jgi:hypothetical protein
MDAVAACVIGTKRLPHLQSSSPHLQSRLPHLQSNAEKMQSKKRTPTGKSPAGVRAKDAIQGGTGRGNALLAVTNYTQLYRQL